MGNEFVDFFESIGGELGRAFENFGNIVANGGASLVGTIGNGVIGVYQDAAGGIAYALDATQATANEVGAWTEGAAGSVANFSLDAYSQAKKGILIAWDEMRRWGLQHDMPQLGPVNPNARTCMKYLLGGSEAAVAGWESNARALGYTMAFSIGCSVQMVGQAAAFSGIYLDRSGNWGFFQGNETSGPAVALPSASASFELWMVFGDRDRFGSDYYKVGLSLELPVALGLNASFDGHVLLTPGFSFLGFRLKAETGLAGLSIPTGGSLGPSVSTPDTAELSSALAEKAGGYDAALRTINNKDSESKLLASAALATLPFVRQPVYVLIQVKGSRRFYEVAFLSTDSRNELYQADLTGYSNQMFAFKDNGDGSFFINPALARVENAALDVAGSSGADGASVVQYALHGANNQRFQIMSADNGWYYLLNKNSGKVLSAASGSLQNQTSIVQRTWDHGQDQMVRFFSAREFPSMGRTYLLTNVATNQQLSCASGLLRLTSDLGRPETWKAESTSSGSVCLRAGNDQYLGTNVSNPILVGAQTSGWHIVPTGDGLFTIERDGKHVLAIGGSLALSCQEYNVPAQMGAYDFGATGRTWELPEAGRGIISFTADVGRDDVYVLISSAAGNTSTGYELIIGGWNNSRSVIRRGKSGPIIADAPVGLTTRGGQNPLWISLDSATGRIEIGRGLPGSDVFLSFKDPSFISAARVVAFSAFEFGIQYSQVTVLPIPANSSVAIPARMGAYQFSPTGKVFPLPEAGRGTVVFTANGDHDVHVAISTQDSAGGQLYEVVIGGWNNSRSVIRRGSQGPELAFSPSGLKAPGKPNPIWISVDSTTASIKVGRGLPGQDMFLSYQDPTFIAAARYVTFSSWDAAIDYSQVSTLALNASAPTPSLGYGLWRLTEVSQVAPAYGAYNTSATKWLLPQGRGVFSFTIDKNDAYILLSPPAGSSNPSYEIVLGGWDNTKCVIRRGVKGTEIASAPAKLLTPGGRNTFWISIDDRTGIIQVGRNAPGQDVFLFVVEPSLRDAPRVSDRFAYLSAWEQPIFFRELLVSPLSPSISPAVPAALSVNHYAWTENLPLAGSLRWVRGCKVRYAAAFEFADGSEVRGPWWTIAHVDANGYYETGYSLPTLTEIPVDGSKHAVARRIYRQFLGEAAPVIIQRIPNNVDTECVDTNRATS